MTQRAPAVCLLLLFFIASAEASSVDRLTGNDRKQALNLLEDPCNENHASAADLTACDAVREARVCGFPCSR